MQLRAHESEIIEQSIGIIYTITKKAQPSKSVKQSMKHSSLLSYHNLGFTQLVIHLQTKELMSLAWIQGDHKGILLIR